jgi:hypothetical protein
VIGIAKEFSFLFGSNQDQDPVMEGIAVRGLWVLAMVNNKAVPGDWLDWDPLLFRNDGVGLSETSNVFAENAGMFSLSSIGRVGAL